MIVKYDSILGKLRESDGDSGSKGFTGGIGWLPAFSLLPTSTTSAYYLEGINPAQIFSATVDQTIKAIINADELPAGTTTIKFRVEARHADNTSPVDRDVVWQVKAGWYAGNWEATLGTAVSVTQTLDADDDKTAISTQSSAITIAGTEGTDDKLYIEIKRAATDGSDSLASDAYLTRIELEFA